MPDINGYRDSFSKKLDNLRDEHDKTSMSIASIYPALADQIQQWDGKLQQRLEEFQHIQPAASVKPTSAPEPATRPHPTAPAFTSSIASLRDWVDDLEKMMLEELEFGRYPLPAGFTAPVHWLDTAAAFKMEVAGFLGQPFLPDGILQNRGVVHIPGRGTFINTSYYQKPEEDLKRAANFIGDVARERWGWGFLMEYTTLGKWAGELGLWQALTSQHLELSFNNNDPKQALAAVLRRSWLLLETGWGEWVWQFVQFKARRAVGKKVFEIPRSGRLTELLIKIINVFPIFITPYGVRMSIFDLLSLIKFLVFEETDLLTPGLHQSLLMAQKFCLEHDQKISEMVGQRLSDILGWVYFSRLEATVGIMATPYAVLIAMHIPVFPSNPTAQMLTEAIENNPRLCPDTRLALLAQLDPRIKYNPRGMFIAAWERYQLDGPREFFRQ